MAVVRYKDLCIDTTGGDALARFWASALGLTFEPADRDDRVAGRLTGPTPQHGVWMNVVAEPRTVKHRVHIDVHTDSVDTLTGLGATVQETLEGWTVMTDPEGGEFCAFERAQVPEYRLYEVVVDCTEPGPLAQWWAEVLDSVAYYEADDEWWVGPVPGAPFESVVFGGVPEPKSVKNRIHWDVLVEDVQVLLDRGATVVREAGDDVTWHVLADPEGNEFCAFVDPRGGG